MQTFSFDRAKAERLIHDPDGALWPVNAYSDPDELDSLVQAAIDSGAISRSARRARLYIYPLSLSEPDPVLVYDPGHGRAFLGHALKLLDREGESPVEFTLRLLEDATAEANALVPQNPTRPATPDDAEEQRTSWPAEVRAEGPEQLDELVRLAADAEIGLTVFDRPPCTCTPSRGCPQCFSRAEAMVGCTVRDDHGRVWPVGSVEERDGFPVLCGDERWASLGDVEVVG